MTENSGRFESLSAGFSRHVKEIERIPGAEWRRLFPDRIVTKNCFPKGIGNCAFGKRWQVIVPEQKVNRFLKELLRLTRVRQLVEFARDRGKWDNSRSNAHISSCPLGAQDSILYDIYCLMLLRQACRSG